MSVQLPISLRDGCKRPCVAWELSRNKFPISSGTNSTLPWRLWTTGRPFFRYGVTIQAVGGLSLPLKRFGLYGPVTTVQTLQFS